MTFLRRSVAASLVFSLVAGCASDARISSKDIDVLVWSAMQEFSVPGAAVGVIKDGIVVHASGYGIRELGLPAPVDLQTMFRIASTSKAFTTASLAMLVDDGKLNWQDKVVDYIPEFALYDPWVTKEFTVADLLTHRSGLEGAAGDLMLWPKPNTFTREDIIAGLRYFKPESGFRTEYAYDNLLYIVAGELVPAITGREWEDFVDERILAGLGAERCFAGQIPPQEMRNLAAPHTIIEGTLQIVERNRAQADVDMAAAAGGLRCGLADMLKWTQLQLARGVAADGSRLFSEQQSRIMWSPHTILHPSEDQIERDRTHFRAYGLAWRLADVYGYKHISHTGSYTGFRSYVILVPELELGVVIMLNASASDARDAIAQGIVKPFLGVHDVDWVAYYSRRSAQLRNTTPGHEDGEIEFKNGTVKAALATYAGRYRDPWFGDVAIEIIDGNLWFVSEKSPQMRGQLWPLDEHTFYVYWEDRTLEADAYISFVLDETATSIGLDMLQVSEEADWDFTDLDLIRVANE